MPNFQELHLSQLTVDDADALMPFGPFTAVTQLRFEGLIVSPQDPGQASKSALQTLKRKLWTRQQQCWSC